MIQLVLIILVAVVVLIAVIGGLAWYYLRGDDDTVEAASVQVSLPDAPERMASWASPELLDLPADHAPASRRLHSDSPDDEPGPDEHEPTDGDAYAAELHAIGQAAASDEWLDDLFRPRRYMVEHWTREEIIRRYAPLSEYRAWAAQDVEAFRARLGFVKVGRQLVAVDWRRQMGLAA